MDRQNLKSAVVKKRRVGLVVLVLPADAESQALGKASLGQAILDGWKKLGIAISGDRDEDRGRSANQEYLPTP
jgi:hypothetical protein